MKIIQGQGDGTEFKERRLGAAFYVNLKISSTSPRLRGYPYFHFDLYAGSGYNDMAGCIGSPLSFLKASEDAGKAEFYAHFVERDPASCSALHGRLAHHPLGDRCFIHPGDNADFIDAIPWLIKARRQEPRFSLGSVLIDPNGHDIPWQRLKWLSGQCPRLDFIVNYNASVVKRLAGFVRNQYGGTLVRLADAPAYLNKQHVLIGSPIGSRNQFVLMVCRNFRVGEHKSLGFYHWDSPQGENIRIRCGLTRGEKAVSTPQGGLFE